MQGMVINMEEAKLRTLAQVKEFLDGTTEVACRVPKEGRNQFIERVLKRFGYAPHGRVDKGELLRYLERMTKMTPQALQRKIPISTCGLSQFRSLKKQKATRMDGLSARIHLAPRPGLEPGTCGLTVRRSTNSARQHGTSFQKLTSR